MTAGSSVRPVSTRPQRGGEAVVLDAGEVGAGAERAAGAGEHERPDLLARRRASMAARSSTQRVEVDGVAALGPVDGDEP